MSTLDAHIRTIHWMLASAIVLGFGLYGLVRTLLPRPLHNESASNPSTALKTAATTPWLALIIIGVMGPITHAEIGKIKLNATEETTESVAGGKVLEPDDVERLTALDDEGLRGYWRLLLYRIEIRKALYEICQQMSCDEVHRADAGGYDPSIKGLLRDTGGTLDSKRSGLSGDMEQYRVLSHKLEWQGTGAPLTRDDIEKLNKLSPVLLADLVRVKNSLPTSRP